jgi:hypothetical protein
MTAACAPVSRAPPAVDELIEQSLGDDFGGARDGEPMRPARK